LGAGTDSKALKALPSTLVRGLRKKDAIVQGKVSLVAFVPDGKRPNGGREASVNWEDDEGALPQVLADKKNSAHGAARVARAWIDEVAASEGCDGALAYERQSLPENSYHGNLVYTADLENVRERMIASCIALKAKFIARPTT